MWKMIGVNYDYWILWTNFLGGGTYYKLSKKDEEEKYKIEYSHSANPNIIPKAEEYRDDGIIKRK